MSDKNKFCKNAGYKSINSSTRSVETRPSSPKATIFAKQSTAPDSLRELTTIVEETAPESTPSKTYILHFD
tara:strand:+ start:1560 stop:1772 length:213 start_codon:yes stop_codon:yes gene_type:complete